MPRRPPSPVAARPGFAGRTARGGDKAPAAGKAPARGARPSAATRSRSASAATGRGAAQCDDTAAQANQSRPRQVAQLLSVRTLVLGVVILSAFTLLFPTVRASLGRRSELDALAAQVTQAEQEEDDLSSELDRWQDPAYVAAQARERLSYVMPGETAYRVIDPEVVVEDPLVEGAPAEPTDGPTLPTDSEAAPWYATVWESVWVAGESPVPADAR